MHSNIYTFFIVRIFDQNLEKKVCARKIHGFLCHANLVDFQKKKMREKKTRALFFTWYFFTRRILFGFVRNPKSHFFALRKWHHKGQWIVRYASRIHQSR